MLEQASTTALPFYAVEHFTLESALCLTKKEKENKGKNKLKMTGLLLIKNIFYGRKSISAMSTI